MLYSEYDSMKSHHSLLLYLPHLIHWKALRHSESDLWKHQSAGRLHKGSLQNLYSVFYIHIRLSAHRFSQLCNNKLYSVPVL